MGHLLAVTKKDDYGWRHLLTATKRDDYGWGHFLDVTNGTTIDEVISWLLL